MNILFITNIPSPYNLSYLEELGKLANVVAVFERGASSERNENWKNIRVENFECIILNGIKIGVDMSYAPKVKSYIKRHRSSKIVIGNPLTPTGICAISYCKRHRIPYILQSEGGIPKNGKGFKEKLKKRILSGASLYLSGMSLKNEYFLQYGASPDRVYQYPFTSLYKKDFAQKVLLPEEKKKIREHLGIQAECMIIFVGQFIHRKAVDVLLKACTDFEDNVYVLIIGGTPTDEYRRIVENLKLKNIHFMEFIGKEKLFEYYSASDMFVLPTREDTWGLVINEAMAHGLPIITTDNCVAGVELINDDENGYIIHVDDADILAKKMKYLVNCPSQRHKMGQNNLEKIQTYTFENMACVIANTIMSMG